MNPLVNLIRLLSPTCQSASRLQSEALDRKLTLLEAAGLRVHLLLCKWCRRYGRQLKFLRSAAQGCEGHAVCAPPAKLSSAARDLIKQKIQQSLT